MGLQRADHVVRLFYIRFGETFGVEWDGKPPPSSYLFSKEIAVCGKLCSYPRSCFPGFFRIASNDSLVFCLNSGFNRWLSVRPHVAFDPVMIAKLKDIALTSCNIRKCFCDGS